MSQKQSRFRKWARRLLWVPAIVLLGVAVWYPLSKTNLLPPFVRTPAWQPLQTPESRDARWRQDLDYLAGQLTRLHPNPYHVVAEEQFWQQVERLDEQIPALSDEAITVEMMRLVALLGDGHTTLHFVKRFHYYPVTFSWLEDGFYVVRAGADHADLLGTRLLAVDGTEVDAVWSAASELVGYENQSLLYLRGTTLLKAAEVLHALGVAAAPDQVTYTLADGAGARQTVTLAPLAPDASYEPVAVTDLIPGGDHRLAQQNPDRGYWFEYLPDERTVYVQYDQCENMDGYPVRAFARDLYDFVDSHEVARIIFDLRYNGGGKSWLLRPLSNGLTERPELNQPGRVFTLIGRRTFSSAVMNAAHLVRENHTLLVGEPSGGKPNAYGEWRLFTLPNSGLTVQYSTRYVRTIEDDTLRSLQPDIDVGVTLPDILAGRDPVLEAALAYGR